MTRIFAVRAIAFAWGSSGDQPSFSTNGLAAFGAWDGQKWDILEGYVIGDASGDLHVKQGGKSGTWDITNTFRGTSGVATLVTQPLYGRYVHVDYQAASGQLPTSGEFRLDLWGKLATVQEELSGIAVSISGQVVKVSGEVVKISGQAVKISGEVVKISGETLITKMSGQVVGVSGEQVVVAQTLSGRVEVVGPVTQLLSGRVEIVGAVPSVTQVDRLLSGRVDVLKQYSGRVEIVGPVTQLVSGRVEVVGAVPSVTQVDRLASGRVDILKVLSGRVEVVGPVPQLLSGRVEVVGPVTAVNQLLSGRVEIVGTPVVKVSGEAVEISGEKVEVLPFTILRAKVPAIITAASGGQALVSGFVDRVVVRALTQNSSDIYIGGSGVGEKPFSGLGMVLEPGDSMPIPVDNFNRIYACAVISGDRLAYVGVD